MAQDDEDVDIHIRVHDHGSARTADKVARSLDDVGDEAAKSGVQLALFDEEVEETEDDLAKLNRRLKQTEDRFESMRRLLVAQTKAIRSQQLELVKMGKANDTLSSKLKIARNDHDRLGSAIGKNIGWMQKFGSAALSASMMVGKMVLIVSALGPVLGTVGALGAGAVAALTGLSQVAGSLAGNLGVLPGLITSMLQGIGTLVIGFKGIGEALKVMSDPTSLPEDMERVMSNLGSNAQQVVIALLEMRQPLKDIRKGVQESLLADMGDTLRNLADIYLPIVRQGLMLTAGALNRVARYGASIFSKPENARAFGTIMTENAKVIELLGRGLVNIGEALMHITVAAAPLLNMMATDLLGVTERFSAWVKDNPEKIKNFFMRSYETLKVVWGIVVDIGTGLFNIGKAAQGMSKFLGDAVIKGAEAFAAWTGSGHGQATMKKFFDDSIPVLQEVGGLVKDLLLMFGRLTMDNLGNTTDFVAKLRTLVEPFEELISSMMSAGLLDSLLDLLKSLLELANSGVMGGFVAALEMVADVLSTIAGFLESLPQGVKDTITELLGFAAVISIFSKLGGVLGIPGMGKRGAVPRGGVPPVVVPPGKGGKPPVAPRAPRKGPGGGLVGIATFLGLGFLDDIVTDQGRYRGVKDMFDDPTQLFNPQKMKENAIHNYKTAQEDEGWRGAAFNGAFKTGMAVVGTVSKTYEAVTGVFDAVLGDSITDKIKNSPEYKAWKAEHDRKWAALKKRGFADTDLSLEKALEHDRQRLDPLSSKGRGFASYKHERDTMMATGASSRVVARDMRLDEDVRRTTDTGGAGRIASAAGASIMYAEQAARKQLQASKEISEAISGPNVGAVYNEANRIARGTPDHMIDKMKQLDDEVLNAGAGAAGRAATATQNMLDSANRKLEALDDEVLAATAGDRAKVAAQRSIDAVVDKLTRMEEDIYMTDTSGAAARAQAIVDAMMAFLDKITGALPFGGGGGTGETGGGRPPVMFAGGQIKVGLPTIVGELGPEAFVGKDGRLTMVGMDGPEVIKFASRGAILPSSFVTDPQRGDPGESPEWAQRAFKRWLRRDDAGFDQQPASRQPVDVPGAETSRVSSAIKSGEIKVRIGPVHVSSDMDMKAVVHQALNEARREELRRR